MSGGYLQKQTTASALSLLCPFWLLSQSHYYHLCYKRGGYCCNAIGATFIVHPVAAFGGYSVAASGGYLQQNSQQKKSTASELPTLLFVKWLRKEVVQWLRQVLILQKRAISQKKASALPSLLSFWLLLQSQYLALSLLQAKRYLLCYPCCLWLPLVVIFDNDTNPFY